MAFRFVSWFLALFAIALGALAAPPGIGWIPCPSWATIGTYGNAGPVDAVVRQARLTVGVCTFQIGLCIAASDTDYPNPTGYTCPVTFSGGVGCVNGNSAGSTYATIIGPNPSSFAPIDPESQGSPFYHCSVHFSGPDPRKNKGTPPCPDCGNPPLNSNPVNLGTGNKFQKEVDVAPQGEGGLGFYRVYNSMYPGMSNMGNGWTHNWGRSVRMMATNEAHAFREDGSIFTFQLSGGNWYADSGVPETLSGNASAGWTLKLRNDDTEQYDASGNLLSVTSMHGRVTTLTYADGVGGAGTFYRAPDGSVTAYPLRKGLLWKVTDFRGRSMQFQYTIESAGAPWRMIDPAGQIHEYRYDSQGNLQSVLYPPDPLHPNPLRTYVYNEPANTMQVSQSMALTGIVDENQARFATYQYSSPTDSTGSPGKATSSSHAGGADAFTFTYGATSTTYVDPLGSSHLSTVGVIQDIAQVTDTTHTCAGVRERQGSLHIRSVPKCGQLQGFQRQSHLLYPPGPAAPRNLPSGRPDRARLRSPGHRGERHTNEDHRLAYRLASSDENRRTAAHHGI